MKFAIIFLAALLLGQVVEPPVFPPGQFCEHVGRGQPPAHPCACHRECLPNIEIGPDGQPHETITIREDAQCKQFCHADHCHCPAMNCP